MQATLFRLLFVNNSKNRTALSFVLAIMRYYALICHKIWSKHSAFNVMKSEKSVNI